MAHSGPLDVAGHSATKRQLTCEWWPPAVYALCLACQAAPDIRLFTRCKPASYGCYGYSCVHVWDKCVNPRRQTLCSNNLAVQSQGRIARDVVEVAACMATLCFCGVRVCLSLNWYLTLFLTLFDTCHCLNTTAKFKKKFKKSHEHEHAASGRQMYAC